MNNLLSELDSARCSVKVILNNNSEYNRLINLVAAKNNCYDLEGEFAVLGCLSQILLTGFDSKKLTSIKQIQYCSYLIEHHIL
jgi:hypothetical protein